MLKSKFLADFKAFAVKGNMIDMAVGVIVGGAFGKIVSSLVSDVLMPPLGLLIGGVDFADLKINLTAAGVNPTTGEAIQAVTLNYGMFIQQVFDFFIIAFSIFMVIRLLSKLKKKEEEKPVAPAPKPEDVALLEEIRDLLKAQHQKESK